MNDIKLEIAAIYILHIVTMAEKLNVHSAIVYLYCILLLL